MEGADKSTELWRHPKYIHIIHIAADVITVVWKHCWHLNRFGVCCVFIFTNSNSAINQNNSYIQNPSFPAGYTGTTGLTYTINKCASSKYLLYKNHIGTGRHTWSLEGVKVLKLFGGIFIFPLTKTKIIGHLKPIDTSRVLKILYFRAGADIGTFFSIYLWEIYIV